MIIHEAWNKHVDIYSERQPIPLLNFGSTVWYFQIDPYFGVYCKNPKELQEARKSNDSC